MILDTLELYNFCLYRGQQSLTLSPQCGKSRSKPIVLVGGINGGGKTTILDAIELALYGSQSRSARRLPGTYESYLKACIHRGVSPTEGASVALTFRYSAEGNEHVYRINRRWNLNRKRITEKLIVYKDGERDRIAAENWQELVQELIPIGLAQLCFFDAEQIRFLADDRSSDERLGASIKSLLGLDLVERLIADASVLESRLLENSQGQCGGTAVEVAQEEFDACQQRVVALKAACANLENERLKAVDRLEKAEQEFAREGGLLSEQRTTRLEHQAFLKSERQRFEQDLRTLAGSGLPIALVESLLSHVATQAVAEAASVESQLLSKILVERDGAIENILRTKGVSDETLAMLSDVHSNDRRSRKADASGSRHLGLSSSASTQLQQLLQAGLNDGKQSAKSAVEHLDDVRRELDETTRSLKMTPSESAVQDVARRLTEAAKVAAVLNQQRENLEDELKSATAAREVAEQRLTNLRRQRIDEQLETEEAARMAKLAVRTQSAMADFLAKATSAKIDRLAGLVTDSFQFLLRKQTLVQSVEIDPQSFAITLKDEHGNSIPKERLSEGEKQIFAISVLWGLAQASPRPLPTIIDTPMARLDSEHRQNLVRRYFPNASHQVIVLSTDTEVNETFHDDLHPHISRRYLLTYDEKEMSTSVVEGYFCGNSLVPAGRQD